MNQTNIVSRLRLIVLIIALSAVAAGPVCAERKILQNDGFSGTATFTQIAGFDEQAIVAATFTADPGDYPFRIENLQALVLAPLEGTIALVSVTVWQDEGGVAPGTVLHTSTYGFQVESSSIALNQLELGCEDIVVTSGSVRVGIVWEVIGDPIGMAFDLDGIIPGLNTVFSAPLGGWWFAEDLGVSGDWIMRIEIETDLTGNPVFSDNFARGDLSCWPSPAP